MIQKGECVCLRVRVCERKKLKLYSLISHHSLAQKTRKFCPKKNLEVLATVTQDNGAKIFQSNFILRIQYIKKAVATFILRIQYISGKMTPKTHTETPT